MISLADADFCGRRHNWLAAMRQLVQQKLVTPADVQAVGIAHLFG